MADARSGLTPVRTAGLTAPEPFAPLRSVSTERRCERCSRRLHGRQQRFCSGACRTADNTDKWRQAPDAVLNWCVSLTLRQIIARAPSRQQIADALDFCQARRRARLMETIGLHWHSATRTWRNQVTEV